MILVIWRRTGDSAVTQRLQHLVMAGLDVVAAVSETLEARLAAGLAVLGPPAPIVRIDDLAEDIPRDPPAITLFLYDIVEETSMRNRPRPVVAPDTQATKPPLALRLHYMMTAWAGDRLTEQRLLGRVMQIMHNDQQLDGVELQGVLAGTDTQLRVLLAPMFLEDRSRVWYAVNKPYRLSVNYEVGVAILDAEGQVAVPAVTERQIAMGVQ